jgi:hypothetical protein
MLLGASDLLIVAATFAVAGSALSRAWRIRSGDGLSAGSQAAQLALGICWLGYYIHAGLHAAIFTGTVSLFVYATLTALAFARGGARDTPYPLIAILAAVTVGTALFGATGAAIALGAPVAPKRHRSVRCSAATLWRSHAAPTSPRSPRRPPGSRTASSRRTRQYSCGQPRPLSPPAPS